MDEVEQLIERLLPRVPTIQLPFDVPSIHVPFIGCFPGDGTTYIGKKFGNRPDLLKLNHIKQFKKDLLDKIQTLIKGKLDNPARSIAFEAEIIRLTQEISDALEAFNETVSLVTEEIQEALALIDDKKTELEGLRSELMAIPEEERSKVDQHMITRYHQYFGELDAQASRLQSTLSCLGAF
ncbi:MAG: hypothetical protein WCF57_09430 [Pyrinomonadaceae bacterium]